MARQMTDLQKRVLAIYKIVKQICDRHNLRYRAAGGTKIGAVLWSGYVPWDDDMDIQLPLPDYEKLLRICRTELPEGLHLLNLLDAKAGGIIATQISETASTIVPNELLIDPSSWGGVYLDFFPMIGTPEDAAARAKFLDELQFRRNQLLRKRFFKLGDTPARQLVREYKQLMHQYNFDDATMICCAEYRAFRPEVFDRAGFVNATKMPFEDTTIYVPDDYDAQLKTQYGKYEKYPPKDHWAARRDYHQSVAFVDLDKPYQYYVDEINKSPIKNYIQYLTALQQKFNGERWVLIEDTLSPLQAEYGRVKQIIHDQSPHDPGIKESMKLLRLAIKRHVKKSARRP